MCEIAIFTWSSYQNYGTYLQCHALSKVIKQLAYDATVIEYTTPAQMSSWNQFLRKSFKVPLYICKFLLQPFHLVKYENISENLPKRISKFNKFKRDFIPSSKRNFSAEDLDGLNANFSAFICGSDQIWNPFLFDSHFFLDFVSDNRKKIAYGPSFGINNIDSSTNAKRIIPLINTFTFLSCREKSGAAWLSEKTGRCVPHVLDPTLLLHKEEWLSLANNPYTLPEHYILCYFLGQNESYWKEIYAFANTHKLSVVIIPIYSNDFSRHGFVPDDIGPCEYIALIKHADFICTDSFHGCCFSVLLEKNFAVFLRFSKKDKKSQNARVCDFLEKFHLQNLFISKKNTLESIFHTKIYYKTVNDIVDMERNKSVLYLSNALSVVTSGVNYV